MNAGFDITFHEVIPESGIVELVVAELEKVHGHSGLHCSVVVSRSGPEPISFDVHVELRSGSVELGLRGYAVDNDQYFAMRQAFSALRDAQAAEEESMVTGSARSRRGLRSLR